MASSGASYEARSVERMPRGAGRRQEPNGGPERLARALGWFSIGLGVAEFVAPRRVAQLIGVTDTDERRMLLRALGLRELASGAGILRGRRPAGWLWSRVGGDAMDLGFLGRAFRARDADPRRVMTATAAVAGVTALDLITSERMTRRASEGIRVRSSVTIDRSPEELYQYWRKLENLPRIMRHLERVETTDGRRSHWRAKAPAGTIVEWDAEIVDDQPNRRIAWRSLEGATVPNRGAVEFVPAGSGRGTMVRVELAYDPPGGAIGAAVAKLFGRAPDQEIGHDLRRLKQQLETGEIPTAKGPSARRRPSMFGQ